MHVCIMNNLYKQMVAIYIPHDNQNTLNLHYSLLMIRLTDPLKLLQCTGENTDTVTSTFGSACL